MSLGSGRVPMWIKLGYTAFLAVLLPVYLRDYGPTNFLYFCDVALLMTFVAVWTESPLWASAPLVGILAPQLFWMVDFLAGAVGMPLTGMTNYMFDANKPLFTRGLSFFHFWLPWLLVYLVIRLGFDRRSWLTWTVLGWILLSICYFVMPGPPAPPDDPNLPVNINYVFGMSDKQPQQLMDPRLWFAMLMVALPLVVWLPTALALAALIRPPSQATSWAKFS